MEKPLISVVVPVYNVEDYLQECLDSLLAQTYPNFEVILVDDASTDGSGGLCDAAAARDRRVQTIRFSENQGPSAARNAGIRRARGAYLSFVDADDRVEPELLERLYQSLTEAGAEVSACGADGIHITDGPARTYSREEAIRCLARGTPFNLVPWGKLYRADLVKQQCFPEDIFYSEDLLFLYRLLERVDCVAYIPDRLYHYTCREGSQMQSGLSERKCTALAAHDIVCLDAAANHPEAVEDFRQLTLEADRCMAMLAVKNGCEGGGLFSYLKQVQANIRRHFTWKALALSPSRKDAVSILLLYVSAAAFWGIAAVYTRLKRLRGA